MTDNTNTQEGAGLVALDYSKIDWSAVSTIVAEGVSLLTPLVGMTGVGPEADVAIKVISSVLVGVLNNVPEAIAIWQQITSGVEPSPADLIKYMASYEAAYQELNADIAAKIAAKQSGV